MALRGLEYTECHAPVTLPRPDFQKLGLKYRRIPVMSNGRDFYCDSLLMLEKLEEWYPDSELTGRSPSELAIEKLLEKWADVVVFKYAAAAIPTNLDLMKDKNFIQDRTELWGRDWNSGHQDSLRAEAVVALRNNFEFLETTIFKDGRKWIHGRNQPSLADIHSAWILQWLYFDITGSLPENLFNETTYPHTVAWMTRYRDAIAAAKEKAPKPKLIEGDEAVKTILGGDFGEPQLKVDEHDFTGLKEGAEVEGWPVDTGFKHRDRGLLVGLTPQEAVIEAKSQNGTTIHVHHPRWNFAVEAAKPSQESHHHDLASHGGDEGVGAEHYGERH